MDTLLRRPGVLVGRLQMRDRLRLQMVMRYDPPASAKGQEGRIANVHFNSRTTRGLTAYPSDKLNRLSKEGMVGVTDLNY